MTQVSNRLPMVNQDSFSNKPQSFKNTASETLQSKWLNGQYLLEFAKENKMKIGFAAAATFASGLAIYSQLPSIVDNTNNFGNNPEAFDENNSLHETSIFERITGVPMSSSNAIVTLIALVTNVLAIALVVNRHCFSKKDENYLPRLVTAEPDIRRPATAELIWRRPGTVEPIEEIEVETNWTEAQTQLEALIANSTSSSDQQVLQHIEKANVFGCSVLERTTCRDKIVNVFYGSIVTPSYIDQLLTSNSSTSLSLGRNQQKFLKTILLHFNQFLSDPSICIPIGVNLATCLFRGVPLAFSFPGPGLAEDHLTSPEMYVIAQGEFVGLIVSHAKEIYNIPSISIPTSPPSTDEQWKQALSELVGFLSVIQNDSDSYNLLRKYISAIELFSCQKERTQVRDDLIEIMKGGLSLLDLQSKLKDYFKSVPFCQKTILTTLLRHFHTSTSQRDAAYVGLDLANCLFKDVPDSKRKALQRTLNLLFSLWSKPKQSLVL